MLASTRSSSARRGLSRIEVVACGVCVLVAVALAAPWLMHSRETARTDTCRDHLKRLGIALHQHAAAPDGRDRLSDGAVDFVRNGCPDEFSWIASVIDPIGDDHAPFVCPATTVVGVETLNDLVAARDSSAALGVDAARLEAGRCNPRIGLLSTEAGSDARRAKVAELLADGYGTTYSPSWVFSHGQPRFVSENLGDQHIARVVPGLDLLENTTGPLTLMQVETAEIPANNIPMLADGAATRVLDSAIGDGREKGMPLAPSASRGPSFRYDNEILPVGENGRTNAYALIPKSFPVTGTKMTPVEEQDYVNPVAGLSEKYGRKLVTSDTRNWGATHGNRANVLMADGAVKTLEDLDGDGLFNPGFARTPDEPAKPGDFATNLVEVAAFEVYTYTFLDPTPAQKGTFGSTRRWRWEDYPGTARVGHGRQREE